MMRPIVLIDSGVGGLTIFDAIYRRIPNASYVYCMDNACFPYGNKSSEMIVARIQYCLKTIQQYTLPAIFVIACNTASLDMLRSEIQSLCDCPIIFVIPPIQSVMIESKHQCVGLLATPKTIQSTLLDQMIQEQSKLCSVIKIGNLELVSLAEKKMKKVAINVDRIQAIIAPFFEQSCKPDQIILGCTHFPLLQHELHCATKLYTITWVSPEEDIANQVLAYWEAQYPGHSVKQPPKKSYVICTKSDRLHPALLQQFQVRHLDGPYYL
ncbi:MAG: glutamate racemase [Endozoicomonadaceae bacterium]|nr:glutamate racemase [Endozoicomonadaceae bacterium]